MSFVCDSGVEVDIAIRDVGGLLQGIGIGGGTLIGELGCFGEDRCFHQFWGCWGVIAYAEWDMIKFQVLLDGWKALKFVVGLMVYQYAVIVYFYFSIGRLESIKQALYELVILHLWKPELFSHEKLLGPQKGVLLYGPL
ncbi:hypothetical protein POTOM_042615 [Populus tomentosa]|uniref:Transmembrane protein n=1 Tax=Populus tomentosa TaxID=118781 RepID=A0A8X7YKX2_POPTO|nr:hypothetical protein POTOM_042615 [Populus tomentosa]